MDKPAELTRREREVLERLPEDLTRKQIAEELFIAVSTLNFHVENIFTKLGVGTREDAVKRAFELGLLIPPTV